MTKAANLSMRKTMRRTTKRLSSSQTKKRKAYLVYLLCRCTWCNISWEGQPSLVKFSMVRFAKKWSCKTEKSYLECLNQLVSLLLSPFHNLSSGVSHLQAWLVIATTHMKKISQQKISSQKYPNKKYLLDNYSNKVLILKHLQPERLHQELHQASLHWEPDHSRDVNQQSLITKLAFSLFICVQPIVRLKFEKRKETWQTRKIATHW